MKNIQGIFTICADNLEIILSRVAPYIQSISKWLRPEGTSMLLLTWVDLRDHVCGALLVSPGPLLGGQVKPPPALTAMNNNKLTEHLLCICTVLSTLFELFCKTATLGSRFTCTVRPAKKIWYQRILFKPLEPDSHRNTE